MDDNTFCSINSGIRPSIAPHLPSHRPPAALGRLLAVTKGSNRPKSGSRARSDSGLTVDGDRVQGSLVDSPGMTSTPFEKNTSIVPAVPIADSNYSLLRNCYKAKTLQLLEIVGGFQPKAIIQAQICAPSAKPHNTKSGKTRSVAHHKPRPEKPRQKT